MDASTKKMLDYGHRLTETLKQGENSPYLLSQQVVLLLSTEEIADLPAEKVQSWQQGLLSYLRAHCRQQMDAIDESGALADEGKATLQEAMQRYKEMAAKEDT